MKRGDKYYYHAFGEEIYYEVCYVDGEDAYMDLYSPEGKNWGDGIPINIKSFNKFAEKVSFFPWELTEDELKFMKLQKLCKEITEARR